MTCLLAKHAEGIAKGTGLGVVSKRFETLGTLQALATVDRCAVHEPVKPQVGVMLDLVNAEKRSCDMERFVVTRLVTRSHQKHQADAKAEAKRATTEAQAHDSSRSPQYSK